jgi:hypothetical protein
MCIRHGHKLLKKVYFKAQPNGFIDVRELPLEPVSEPDTLIYVEFDLPKAK